MDIWEKSPIQPIFQIDTIFFGCFNDDFRFLNNYKNEYFISSSTCKGDIFGTFLLRTFVYGKLYKILMVFLL